MTLARRPRHRRGFSMIEMLVALTITATLMTAALTALDASFKSYKATTEGASTHVVSRIVMHRIMSMVRTGSEFGPYPVDTLDLAQNPVTSDFIEFVALAEPNSVIRRVIRIETRTSETEGNGPRELWYVQCDYDGLNLVLREESLLIPTLEEATFTLEYDVGPRLRRATVDITVRPNDVRDASIKGDLAAPSIRLVSTACPRRLDLDE